MENLKYVLEMENITKEFPGVKALDNVQLKLKPGTVHAWSWKIYFNEMPFWYL